MSEICEPTGKIKHANPQQAHTSQKRLTKRQGTTKTGQMYKCAECKCWHITSKQGKMR